MGDKANYMNRGLSSLFLLVDIASSPYYIDGYIEYSRRAVWYHRHPDITDMLLHAQIYVVC